MIGEIQRAVQRDGKLARGRFTVRLIVSVAADGTIGAIRLAQGSGDEKRDQLIRAQLAGLRFSQQPPAGLPTVTLEINARPSI